MFEGHPEEIVLQNYYHNYAHRLDFADAWVIKLSTKALVIVTECMYECMNLTASAT